jgi:hypothetical protein
MQRVPLHSGEKKVFKPEIFAEMQAPPSFTLKTPTRRDREEMQYALHEAGLRRHSDEDIREAMIDELCRLWNCDQQNEEVVRLKAFWRAVDDYNDEAEAHRTEVAAAAAADEEPPAELAPFSHPDQQQVDELVARLGRSSALLRRMGTENVRFEKEWPRYAVAHCVIDWTGLETQPRFEAGILKLDSVLDLQDELETKFATEGEVAFIELVSASITRFYLNKATEKNSSSGPASSRTPRDSKEAGQASTNGTSPASASSDETLEGSSTSKATD